MSQGEVSNEERNAYVDYKEEQNERKAQHHDDTSQTLRIVRIGLFLGVVFALVALSIYAFEKLGDKSDKLANRSIDNHFHKAIAYELAADERFKISAAKLCYFIEKKGEPRSEYVNEAKQLGALLTASWLEDGCGGDCKNLVGSK